MKRAAVGVIVGFAVWSAMWLGGNSFLFAEVAEVVGAGEPFTESGVLAKVLALSVACSLVAGLVTKGIVRGPKAVLVLSVLLLAVGLAVQTGSWELLPVWYHLTFLALLVPVTVAGGKLVSSRRTAPA